MDAFKRGARVHSRWRRLASAWQAVMGPANTLRLASVALTALDETKHFKIVGTTGTGKSTAIAQLLRTALQRGDRAIVADPDGGYRGQFHDHTRGDVILNPFERKSVSWNPFAELHTDYDVDQLASGLIPWTEDAASREWRAYARTFLAAVASRRRHDHRADAAELWRLVATASTRELKRVVLGTPAQPFLEADNARMFGSIRSVAGSSIAALSYMKPQPGGSSFSVRQWVRAGRGSLFIPYRANQIAALRTIIATWMRLAIFEAMSGAEGDRRLWIVVDELDALGAIDGLKDALARLRKFGGRCVIGFQSLAQVTGTYGSEDAQTIIENCGNSLILRCSGSDQGGTSHFASRLIGEREVIRRQTTRGADRDLFTTRAARRSINVSEQHVTEAAVLPSELEQLPDLTGYAKTASSGVWQRVRLQRSPCA